MSAASTLVETDAGHCSSNLAPLRVLHVIGSAGHDWTSIAKIITTLNSARGPQNYSIEVLSLGGNGPLRAHFESAGINFYAMQWKSGVRDPLGAFGFWQLMRRLKCDIVHLHFGGRSVRWLGRKATGAKVLLHLHAITEENSHRRSGLLKTSGADGIIAVSYAVAGLSDTNAATVIHPAVTLGPSTVQTENVAGDCVIGTASRLVPGKGIGNLIRALPDILQRHPGVRLEIAGDGPERDCLAALTCEMGLGNKISFLGWQSEIALVMRRWKVMVLPTLGEGFPLSCVEAMNVGVPVVASSVGGIPEIIEDNVTGLLVPPGDRDALARTVNRLLDDAGLRERMGAAGRDAVGRFSPARMAGEVRLVYDQLLRWGSQPIR